MLNTDIYKSEFQDMLRNRSESIHALEEGSEGIADGYIIPGYDAKKFYQAMAKDFKRSCKKIS